MRYVGVLALSAFISACSNAPLHLANILATGFDGEIHRAISYGDDPLHKADIYVPKSATKGAAVVVFYHGGSWTDGNRKLYAFVAKTLAERGFIVVVPDYRKHPETTFPVFVEDSAQAAAWTINEISAYGGDPSKVFLSGHSSGAHQSALILTDRSYLAEFALAPEDFAGFVGLSGPYSFTPKASEIVAVFGELEDYSKMQVDTFVTGTEPPMLLMHGGEDEVVVERNMHALAQAITDRGGRVETAVYDKLDHAGPAAEFVRFKQHDSELVRDFEQFVKRESDSTKTLP